MKFSICSSSRQVKYGFRCNANRISCASSCDFFVGFGERGGGGAAAVGDGPPTPLAFVFFLLFLFLRDSSSSISLSDALGVGGGGDGGCAVVFLSEGLDPFRVFSGMLV